MPRVYLIFRNQIFGDAIRAILCTHPEIELVGATAEPDRVATDVATVAPDVILLEETNDTPSIRDVRTILSSPIPCRLITLRMDEDGMRVWSQTRRRRVRTEDLVQAILTAGTTTATDSQERV